MRALLAIAISVLMTMGALAGPRLAEACAGLIGSNGAVNLGRTTTLAAYQDGLEHYVTAFQFQGGGGEFGSLIPLPAVPTKVERGGAWTLQRLQLETQPQVAEDAALRFSAELPATGAVVLQEVRIDALDLTVLKGGGADVAVWAKEHGFRLSPDAPEVLDFYARRSPIFLAAVFDGDAALERGQQIGDGTPVHITMPTENPWVPLRILTLGKQPEEQVVADVFLLTDEEPALLPSPRTEGFALTHNDVATTSLLDDLRSDDGMTWVPRSAWLTKIAIDTSAAELDFDLAVDTSGRASPSPVAAGLELPSADSNVSAIVWAIAAAAAAALIAGAAVRLDSPWRASR
jgi:hypothetical protein